MASSDWITVENFDGHIVTRRILPVLAFLLMTFALVFIFLIVPDEQEMGAVQRIFYFHVGSAITSYVMIGVLLLGSSFYLLTREQPWDVLAQAAAGAAFLFCSLVLITGMIWGHSSWHTWWRWEPRLVTSLVLWLILGGYLIIRTFAAGHSRQQGFLAVLGIIAAVFVPIVVFSIRLLNQAEQLHPQVIARQGLVDPLYRWCLLFSTITLIVFAVWLLSISVLNRLLALRVEQLERDLDQLNWQEKRFGTNA